LLDNWIQSYLKYTNHSESPTSFHFWTGVSMIGGALRRQVWIDQRYFQWTPNFYIILVAPAGIAAKSTSARIGIDLLREINVNIGPQSITWQALTESLDQSKELVLMPDGAYLPMSCITCSVSELGTFIKPSDQEMIDVLVGLWDGQIEVWERATKTQGSDSIENPWINIIGCTTPSWLNSNFTETMMEGGLVSRIVFVYGDKKRHLVPYPADAIDSSTFSREREALVHDLDEIAHMRGEICLSADAKEWGRAWYAAHWSGRPAHMADPRYSGYIARKQTHLHKLAIVMSAAHNDDLIITLDEIKRAETFVTQLERDMQKVFQSVGAKESSRPTNDVIALLFALGPTTQKDLWRHCMMTMPRRDFLDAIHAATQAGYIQTRTEDNTVQYYLTGDGKRRMKGEEG